MRTTKRSTVLADIVADIHFQPPGPPDEEHHARALGQHHNDVEGAEQAQALGGFAHDKVVDGVAGKQRVGQVRPGHHQQDQNGPDHPRLIPQAVVHQPLPDLQVDLFVVRMADFFLHHPENAHLYF